MSDFVDDLLAGLEEDKSKPRESVERAVKLQMNSRDNQGTVVFAPFKCEPTSKFWVPMPGVREFKMTCSLYGQGNTEVWTKVLPKDLLIGLTESQSKLYDEVTGLFDEVYKKYESRDKSYLKIRYRSYSLFQGVLLNHISREGKKITDNIGKAVILVFPSKSPIDAMSQAINAKIQAMGGSKEWVPAVFSPTDKGRQGVMTITFTKPDKPGYESQIGFEFNSGFSKVIDPEEGFPTSVTDLLGDPVSDWLGWQNGESSRFNETVYKELKASLEAELLALDQPASVESHENVNGVDPMMDSPKTSTEPTTSSLEESDLPF